MVDEYLFEKNGKRYALLIRCDLSVEGVLGQLQDSRLSYRHTIPLSGNSSLSSKASIAIFGQGFFIEEVTNCGA
jgi:hypothetical protein